LGGGGGSGTYTSGMVATSGGDGGGIILIMAKVIKTNDKSIIADGESVTEIAEASAGGAGAAGSIVFDVESVIGDLTLSVSGGNGGLVYDHGVAGPGGGGAGGPLLYNFSEPNVDYTLIKKGGRAGYAKNLEPAEYYHKATTGKKGGTIKANVKVPLTGFLFNSITPDQEVCMGQVPDLIYGSEPRGGDGTYAFEWQMINDTTSGYIIPGATQRDYQPPALTDTTEFQRIVTSAGGTIVDKGNTIKIIVQSNIVNNQIFGDDTIICIGNEADTIIGTSAIVTGGNYQDYNYTWQYSFDEQSWTTDNALNDTTYLHGTVTDTTLVRRIVQSGACYDTTTNIKITGLPPISNNVLSDDQEICRDQKPEPIIGAVHEGGLGLGTDSIYWQERTETGSWIDLADSSRKDLAPSNLVETMYYRRVILSDDCEDFSDPVKVNVLPPIANNTITTESVIYTCYGTAPQQIIASEPSGGAGAGSYSYQWQESADAISWTDISSNANSKDYQPEALIDTTYFRRQVFSGIDDCCSSISDTVRVNIYELPVATIQDIEDTICSGNDVVLNMNISNGKTPYVITYNDGFNDFTSDPINAEQYNPVHQPETENESEIFDYTLIAVSDDNGCEATDMSGLTKIHVYGNPNANAGSKDEACDLSYQLSATPTLGTGYWSHVSEIGNVLFDDVNAANAMVTVDTAGQYNLEWKEINWQCEDKDTVGIDFYERPYNIHVNPQDTTLYFVDEVTLNGGYINPDQYEVTSIWDMNLQYGDLPEILDSAQVTLTELNDQGQDQISVTWTVSKRQCEDTTVNISIKLKELFNPTGFTPNGDGVNDYLKFNGIENSDAKQLIIYNRWGTEVYNKKGAIVEAGWDGKNEDKKDLPEDTYYYILIVTDDGVTQTHKGFIVLKRY
jgi:gliding motility-associated-like protein